MVSSGRVEVSIATLLEFRKRGLAKAVSAQVVREALRQGPGKDGGE
jgi:hypothetical protein